MRWTMRKKTLKSTSPAPKIRPFLVRHYRRSNLPNNSYFTCMYRTTNLFKPLLTFTILKTLITAGGLRNTGPPALEAIINIIAMFEVVTIRNFIFTTINHLIKNYKALNHLDFPYAQYSTGWPTQGQVWWQSWIGLTSLWEHYNKSFARKLSYRRCERYNIHFQQGQLSSNSFINEVQIRHCVWKLHHELSTQLSPPTINSYRQY